MSNNRKQKLEYKYLKGFIDKVPINIRKKWDRHNFYKGECRALKRKLVEKIMNKEFKIEFNAVIMPNGCYMDEYRLVNKTIGDIVCTGYELTESAIKQIGL